MNWIDEKTAEFDEQFVPTDWLVASAREKPSHDSGINNGVAMYHTLRIKEWLRTALADSYEKGYNDAYEKLQNLQPEKQGDAS